MKTKQAQILFTILLGCFLWSGCQTTPGKYISSSSTTVNHAMQAWAVYVVDGRATPEQEAAVRAAKDNYDVAEDVAVIAYAQSQSTGDQSRWIIYRDLLSQHQAELIQLVTLFTGKKP